MNVVDSSGWLEYFAGSKNAKNFAKVIEDLDSLLVPSVIVYEVFKKVLQVADLAAALEVVAHMKQGQVVELDMDLSIFAAQLSVDHKLPMADSFILATARRHEAVLWTQDSDFEGLEGVKFFRK